MDTAVGRKRRRCHLSPGKICWKVKTSNLALAHPSHPCNDKIGRVQKKDKIERKGEQIVIVANMLNVPATSPGRAAPAET